jgi:ubiquinone biosynthesis protein UbiJ
MEKVEIKVISVEIMANSVEIMAVFVEIIIYSVENMVICVVTIPNSVVNTGPKCSDKRQLSFIGTKKLSRKYFLDN